MRNLGFTALLTLTFVLGFNAAASGRKLRDTTIIDLKGRDINIPYLGERNLLIFYVDPDKHNQNDDFVDDMEKNKRVVDCDLYGYGIINLEDTVFPSNIVRAIARLRTKSNGALIVADKSHSVAHAWGLGDCNNKFITMIVSKERELLFINKGPISPEKVAEFYRVAERFRQK